MSRPVVTIGLSFTNSMESDIHSIPDFIFVPVYTRSSKEIFKIDDSILL